MDQVKAPPQRWLSRAQWKIHWAIWNVTGGRGGARVRGMPVLELVTTGHRSGEPRKILITYVPAETGRAIAGTNAGMSTDPAWVKNLRANPAARVSEAGEWSDVRARFVEGDEWTTLWDQFAARPGYADYRMMTDRSIPIVILEPV